MHNTLTDETSANSSEYRKETGLKALITIAAFHGISLEFQRIKLECEEPELSTADLILIAKKYGLHARSMTPRTDRLSKCPLPSLTLARDGIWGILINIEPDVESEFTVTVIRPNQQAEKLTAAEYRRQFNENIICVSSRHVQQDLLNRFDFTWFIPAVVRYRKMFGEIVLASVFIQLAALVTPLFFQVITDKVLGNRAIETLNVITIGVLAVVVFEVCLTYARTYLFAHTASKLDVELGSNIYSHLQSLPLSYFKARRIGDSVARVRELENIRTFVTGNAISILLDIAFSLVFFAALFFYSTKLASIVATSIPIYVVISAISAPILRSKLDRKFKTGAENQAFLVESISGIGTIKALALEGRFKTIWNKQLAAYVVSTLDIARFSMGANSLISLTGKLVTILIMWFGTQEVIAGDLSVGELIAFNMLASNVSNPILRLSQVWSDFQQVGISMARLGDILNAAPEATGRSAAIATIEGEIEFRDVSFKYSDELANAIAGVSLHIKTGEVLGIVGASGSGKSTLAKLVQRLYFPSSGRIYIDGVDIGLLDPTSIRRQIGVVQQDNTLFTMSIRANISIADPTMPIERVVAAAKLAGAHEFISQLPMGYDTLLGENNSGLSTGQCQRISIARALVTNPKIIIFDEATSALDYESERAIQNNMSKICAGRTVIVIAHRQSALQDCTRIVSMRDGKIVDEVSTKTPPNCN